MTEAMSMVNFSSQAFRVFMMTVSHKNDRRKCLGFPATGYDPDLKNAKNPYSGKQYPSESLHMRVRK